MVGSAIVRQLQSTPQVNLITRTRAELDLTDQKAVFDFFAQHRIDEVYIAAARVGGIMANQNYPADFIYDNLVMQCNIIQGAFQSGVKKLLFLGSSCIYPVLASQPMGEDALLTGPLEPSNEPYAVAKIAGIKLCESYNRQYGLDYRSIMPTNLYGPNDNFHPEKSHVIPALIHRFHKAKQQGRKVVTVWGSGSPKREFLHVDDMATASIHVMNLSREAYQAHSTPMLSHLNVGTGKDCSIKELVETIARVVGYQGAIKFDTSKPDGAPRKLLNVEKLSSLGWNHSIDLNTGLQNTYEWFLAHQSVIRS